MQGETATAMKASDSDGKLDAAPSPHNNRGPPRGVSKAWQYSDHMENICGYLMKYTNLVTGWQFRFFVLNNEAGLLEYFVNEQSKNQKARGTVQLAGAVISPSDEDSHTFSVNAASGELYKLRASDAKERQHWVSRLQICTQHHTEAIGKNNPPLKSRSFSLASQGSGNSPGSQRRASQSTASFFNHHRALPVNRRAQILQPDHLGEVREMMSRAESQQRDLMRTIEGLPPGGQLSALDQDLLMLKATSMATLNCLNDCFHMLHQQHTALQKSTLPVGVTVNWLEPKILLSNHLENGGGEHGFGVEEGREQDFLTEPQGEPQLDREVEDINSEDELEDSCEVAEDDLGAVEEQRSVILHLLSQLKLGMDLTRVVLPTFILEKRSLLEMYADFLSHPDLFLSIGAGLTPEERMVRFVEYYLTSFHEGRKGALAKKPYNPIIGETFHCSWKVPSDSLQTPKPSETPEVNSSSQEETGSENKDFYTVRFVAEQVSHHPPVSGFYAECPERNMCVNTHVWTKSKFMGMSIGVTMIGEGVLHLLDHDEEYTFTLPCAYARSILTVPWVELGGKVNVNCAKTGYSATITFHTKPFYGGKLHRVTGEVKHNATNTVVCKIQGEWNSILEFTYSNGETKSVDLMKLPVTRKRVRPVEKQGLFESRRLWSHVTESLMAKNIEEATEHKRALEERQRAEERHRAETETPWMTKYFSKEGDGWIYNKSLWKSSVSGL
ncbi:oxysterol-binding protein-related protein 11 [Rana temporaria]|uniref:oxysterol-binding protein-related protein 11-like n=1 Tax=Rana temporaria TaxID=8407 RepID=UPI001AACA0C1|nr:oxysterol-binding protein-related protein 11-like [Rana temporaria]XP_040214252.1 oxysterol-binding protein-related protein 11 [Rana temporaria]